MLLLQAEAVERCKRDAYSEQAFCTPTTARTSVQFLKTAAHFLGLIPLLGTGIGDAASLRSTQPRPVVRRRGEDEDIHGDVSKAEADRDFWHVAAAVRSHG